MRSAPPIELHSQAILAVVGLAERVAEWRGMVLTPGDNVLVRRYFTFAKQYAPT